jgi:hypothetical protein
VRPFDVTLLAPAAPDAQRAAPAAAGAASLLAAPSARETPPLLEIEVRVSWEGAPADATTGEPFAIRRRTFALNPAALEALPGAEAGGAGDEEGEE